MSTFVLLYVLVSLVGEAQGQGQNVETDFNDLGKLMLLGFAAAIVFALAFTFVRLRLREKNPQQPGFISISAPVEKKEEAGT